MSWDAIAFVALLGITAAVCLLRGQTGISRAAAVVLANCLIGTWWVMTRTTGYEDDTPIEVLMTLNIISMAAVLWHPAARPQAMVGSLYVFALMLDAAFFIGRNDPHGYLVNSAIVGWVQLSVLAIGAADDDCGKSRIARWFGRRFGARVSAYFARLAAPE
jgi:hypothetical protein